MLVAMRNMRSAAVLPGWPCLLLCHVTAPPLSKAACCLQWADTDLAVAAAMTVVAGSPVGFCILKGAPGADQLVAALLGEC